LPTVRQFNATLIWPHLFPRNFRRRRSKSRESLEAKSGASVR